MSRPRSALAVACSLALLASSAVVAQPLKKVGTEFQINSYTATAQYRPAAAADADGDFVVAWASTVQDGSPGVGVFARRFDSAGAPRGIEFQVNSHTPSYQYHPSVVANGNGDFVVAWTSVGQDGSENGIFARRFEVGGSPLAPDFQVNVHTVGRQFYPAIAADGDGDFAVVWQSIGQDGNAAGIFGRRFSGIGAPQGVEFQVNTHTLGAQYDASMARTGDGDFVVVWASAGQDGDSGGIFGRRFDSAGAPAASEFQVNAFSAGKQYYPAVASDSEGNFVVVWSDTTRDGSVQGVFGRRFDSMGTPQGTEFQVNSHTLMVQFRPEVAADGDGDFLVTWLSFPQDGNQSGIFARRFTSAGIGQAVEFQVNTYTTNYQLAGVIATDRDGAFTVAWASIDQDGDGQGIFGQRFATGTVLDVDANGDVDALTDGLLVLRYRFGFTGATLTNGALAPDCTRCNAMVIEPYIAGLGLLLDIDNNGDLEPLTDGLLVLRFIFGFTGGTLTNGAVANDCVMRCDASTILPYLETLD